MITKIIISGLIYGIIRISIISGRFIIYFCKVSLFAIRAVWEEGFIKNGGSANKDAPSSDAIEAKSLIAGRLSEINHSLGFRG